jgi:hypothetical protein
MCFLFNNKNEIGTQMAHSKRILFRRNEGKKERKRQTIEKENNRKKSLGKSLDRAEKDREEKESFFHSTFLKS